MRIMVLGGDGFCGWPTSLYLSRVGHNVAIIDNFVRREIDEKLGISSLTPIQLLPDRLNIWKRITGREIECGFVDVAESCGTSTWIKRWEPEVIIHFAKQRSAPYSMKTLRSKQYTVNNNVQATHNVLSLLVELELDAHLIHLGSTGVYGYGFHNMEIPEGYLDVQTPEGSIEILHPQSAGSIYHVTKCIDEILFQFYARNDELRITDLHQGIVWGTQTEETMLDEGLINRFDYDGDYGTVLNRFLMQSALKYPLTVYGTGGQTRAFIHIRDTVRCIEAAIEHPPEKGERPKILNQMSEVHTIVDLASLISEITGTPIQYLKNPRKEAESNTLQMCNDTLTHLGTLPTLLQKGLLEEVVEVAGKYKSRANLNVIPCTSLWTKR